MYKYQYGFRKYHSTEYAALHLLDYLNSDFRRKASVSEMLHDLGWQSLDGRRQDQRLVLFYKIINGLASVETEDILTPADSRTRKNHSFKYQTPPGKL